MSTQLKCPKCRAKCVSHQNTPRRNPSSICIADQSGQKPIKFLNDADFKMRIWSYMKPPRISEPIQAVSDERLEVVRTMLDKSVSSDQPSLVHIDSDVNVEVLHDGTIRKTTSRLEVRTYPPRPGMKLKGPNGSTCPLKCPPCFGKNVLTSTRIGE